MIGLQFLRRMSSQVVKNNSFDRCLQQVKMISIGDGRCSAQFKVADEHLNRYGVLHGGFTASLVETVTSEALLARPNCPFGVSVEMHVTFMKGARPGDEVLVDASPVRSGKNFAFMECELRHKRDNSIIARGTHTVYYPATKM